MNKILKVGLDIRDLNVAKTGAKTYLEELYKEFKENGEKYNCEFYFFDTSLPIYTGSSKFLKIFEHISYQIWKQITLPIKAMMKGCDILFCTDYFVPLINLGYKTIPVFYDAFFWEYPQHYNKLWLSLFKIFGVTAARKSPYIITLTHYSQKQLAKYTKIASEKIVPIHLAPKTLKKETTVAQDVKTTKLPDVSKFILHIGTLEKRKNLVRLIEAFDLLQKEGYTDYSLILVGQASIKTQMDDSVNIVNAVKERGLEDKVVIYGYASNEELTYFYNKAELYIFPSLNEGFGLPVLEAFEYNLPVVIANNTCLPEVSLDAALQFDPYDAKDMMQKMKDIIDDPVLRATLVTRGQKRLKDFSWQRTANQVVEVFRRVADQNK